VPRRRGTAAAVGGGGNAPDVFDSVQASINTKSPMWTMPDARQCCRFMSG